MHAHPTHLALAVALSSSLARAEPPAAPPPALVFVEGAAPGKSPVVLGTADFGASTFTPVLEDLPTGTWGMAVHAASGTWALSGAPTGGEPLALAGQKPVAVPGAATLLVGKAGAAGFQQLAGDPTCRTAKCYEVAAGFTPDAGAVLTQQLRLGGTRLVSVGLDAAHRRATVFDRPGAAQPVLSADQRRVGYLTGGALFVEPLPLAKAKPQPLGRPTLLMDSPLALASEQLLFFRREPVEQRRGFIEAWKVGAKTAALGWALPADFPMLSEQMVFSPAASTVLLADAEHSELGGNLVAIAVPGLQARKLATGVRRVLDASPDGRWALVVRRKDPARADYADNPEQLVVIDLGTGTEGAVLATGVPGAKIPLGRFFTRR